MAAIICSHQDIERKNVSFTAQIVAMVRGLEKEQENPLFVDPYAKELAGTRAQLWLEEKKLNSPEYLEYLYFFLFHAELWLLINL